MTLNAKIGGFCGFFWQFRAATQVYIIYKVAPWNYHYAIQIKNLVFVYLLSVNTSIFS